MQITEVRIKLTHDSQDRLLGFCSITIDGVFVIRDLKIINGLKGPFVAMPSRKLMDRCDSCGSKNQLRAAYCSQCGVALGQDRSEKLPDGRAKLYADIAHPISAECREQLQSDVLQAYDKEIELAKLPNYVCRYEDVGGEFDGRDDDSWDSSDPAPSGPSHSSREPKQRFDRRDLTYPETIASRHSHIKQSAQESMVRQDEFGAGVFG